MLILFRAIRGFFLGGRRLPHHSGRNRISTTTTTTTTTTAVRMMSDDAAAAAVDFDGLMDQVLNQRRVVSSSSCSSKHGPRDDDGDPQSSNEQDEWRRIDWTALAAADAAASNNNTGGCWSDPAASPVDAILVSSQSQQRRVFVKRDDQLRLAGSQLSGNKARKMLALQELLNHEEFPSCVVSFGGPQSNAMLAIAAVVRYHNDRLMGLDHSSSEQKRFVYYTKKLPKFLRKTPSGNLFRAQLLGMELVEVSPAEYGGR